MRWNQMVLWDERKEATPSVGIPGIPRQNLDILQTLSDLHVLGARVIRLAQLGIGQRLDHKATHCLPAEDIPGTAGHIALLHVRLELAAEVDRGLGIVRIQHVAHVLHYRVGVVVGLQEPVGVVDMVLVDVLVRLLRLAPQVVATLAHGQSHRVQFIVLGRAHEDELVAALAPGALHVPRLLLVVARIGHDPAQHSHLAVELLRNGGVLMGVLMAAHILLRPRQLHHVVTVVGIVHVAMPVAIVGHELAAFRSGGVHE